MGPGLKNGVVRSKRENLPLKLSLVPVCQQAQMVRSACTTSRIRGAGASHFTEKRRSLWPFTCEPSPRMKRPPEALARSQEMWARTMGLRGKATAIDVPSLMRLVAVAATASGRKGSCCVSADHRQSKPSASTFRAYSGIVLRSWVSMPTSSFTRVSFAAHSTPAVSRTGGLDDSGRRADDARHGRRENRDYRLVQQRHHWSREERGPRRGAPARFVLASAAGCLHEQRGLPRRGLVLRRHADRDARQGDRRAAPEHDGHHRRPASADAAALLVGPDDLRDDRREPGSGGGARRYLPRT